MKMQKKVLIIGEHSYIGQAFKRYAESMAGGRTADMEASGSAGNAAGGRAADVEADGSAGNMTDGRAADVEVAGFAGSMAGGRWQVDAVGAADGAWRGIDFSGYDTVLHVAAIVHQKEEESKRQLYLDVNEKLPAETARKAKEAGVRQFVFLSTMAVYGDVEGAITAQTPLKPVTMYGKTKLAAEAALEELETENKASENAVHGKTGENFKVAIVRPPMVYGENCPGNYSRLKKLARVFPVFPDIENKRSMISVDNLCRCLMRIMEEERSGIFHPQDEKTVNTIELFVGLRAELGKKTLTTKRFNGLVRLAAKHSGSVRKMFGSCYYDGIC